MSSHFNSKNELSLAFQFQNELSLQVWNVSCALARVSATFGVHICARRLRGLWTLVPPCATLPASLANPFCSGSRFSHFRSTNFIWSRLRFNSKHELSLEIWHVSWAPAGISATLARQFFARGLMRRKYKYLRHFGYFVMSLRANDDKSMHMQHFALESTCYSNHRSHFAFESATIYLYSCSETLAIHCTCAEPTVRSHFRNHIRPALHPDVPYSGLPSSMHAYVFNVYIYIYMGVSRLFRCRGFIPGPLCKRGPMGPKGCMGPWGPMGPQGAHGAQGAHGPKGSMGPWAHGAPFTYRLWNGVGVREQTRNSHIYIYIYTYLYIHVYICN